MVVPDGAFVPQQGAGGGFRLPGMGGAPQMRASVSTELGDSSAGGGAIGSSAQRDSGTWPGNPEGAPPQEQAQGATGVTESEADTSSSSTRLSWGRRQTGVPLVGLGNVTLRRTTSTETASVAPDTALPNPSASVRLFPHVETPHGGDTPGGYKVGGDKAPSPRARTQRAPSQGGVGGGHAGGNEAAAVVAHDTAPQATPRPPSWTATTRLQRRPSQDKVADGATNPTPLSSIEQARASLRRRPTPTAAPGPTHDPSSETDGSSSRP